MSTMDPKLFCPEHHPLNSETAHVPPRDGADGPDALGRVLPLPPRTDRPCPDQIGGKLF
jgi:hypothetical protein